MELGEGSRHGMCQLGKSPAARALLRGHTALLSIPESLCPCPLLLVRLVQLVHPKSGPAFLSCPSGAKGLPVCKEDILSGMSPASAQHGGGEQ